MSRWVGAICVAGLTAAVALLPGYALGVGLYAASGHDPGFVNGPMAGLGAAAAVLLVVPWLLVNAGDRSWRRLAARVTAAIAVPSQLAWASALGTGPGGGDDRPFLAGGAIIMAIVIGVAAAIVHRRNGTAPGG